MSNKVLIISEQRRSTEILIREDPTSILLVRPGTFGRTASGGQTRSGPRTNFTEKDRYFAPLARENRYTVDWQGKRVEADYIIIGKFDDEMQAGDTFVVDGVPYEIIYVNSDRRWESKGFVTRA